MFKINNRSTWCLSGEFIANFEYIWHFVLVFFWWVWICKCRMEYWYCLSLHLSMCFRVQSSSPVTFKTKLSVTTVINISLLLYTHFFSQKAPSWMLQLNVVARSMKILIDIGWGGNPYDWVQHWENIKNFQRFFRLSSL